MPSDHYRADCLLLREYRSVVSDGDVVPHGPFIYQTVQVEQPGKQYLSIILLQKLIAIDEFVYNYKFLGHRSSILVFFKG